MRKEIIIEAMTASKNESIVRGLADAYVHVHNGVHNKAKDAIKQVILAEDYKTMGGAELSLLVKILKQNNEKSTNQKTHNR